MFVLIKVLNESQCLLGLLLLSWYLLIFDGVEPILVYFLRRGIFLFQRSSDYFLIAEPFGGAVAFLRYLGVRKFLWRLQLQLTAGYCDFHVSLGRFLENWALQVLLQFRWAFSLRHHDRLWALRASNLNCLLRLFFFKSHVLLCVVRREERLTAQWHHATPIQQVLLIFLIRHV